MYYVLFFLIDYMYYVLKHVIMLQKCINKDLYWRVVFEKFISKPTKKKHIINIR